MMSMMHFLATFVKKFASPSVVYQDIKHASTKTRVKMKREHLHMHKTQ